MWLFNDHVRPTGCSVTSSSGTTGGSALPLPSRIPRTVPFCRASPLMPYCASSTLAPWPMTTPSTSTAPRCKPSPMVSQLRPGSRRGPRTLGRQHRAIEPAPAGPVVLRARNGQRSSGQLPPESPAHPGRGGYGTQTTAPRPLAKTQVRAPAKPAPNHPWRRPLLT